MRSVRSELDNFLKSRLEALEHAVERFREPLQLVTGLWHDQPARQVLNTDTPRRLSDLINRGQSTSAHPVASRCGTQQQNGNADEKQGPKTMEGIVEIVQFVSDLNEIRLISNIDFHAQHAQGNISEHDGGRLG